MADLNFEDSIKLAYYKLVDTLTGAFSDENAIRQFVGIGMEELTSTKARSYASNHPASAGNLYTSSGMNCVEQYAGLWSDLVEAAEDEVVKNAAEKSHWDLAQKSAQKHLDDIIKAHGGSKEKDPAYLAELLGWDDQVKDWREQTKGKTLPNIDSPSATLDAFFTKGAVLDMSSGELDNFHLDGDLSGEFSKGVFSVGGKLSGELDFSKAAGFKASKVEFRCYSINSFPVKSSSSVNPSAIMSYIKRYDDEKRSLYDTIGAYCADKTGSLTLYPTEIIVAWLPYIRIHVSAKDGLFIDAALKGDITFGVGGELFGLKIGANANFNLHIQHGSNNDFILNIVPTQTGEHAQPVILAVKSAKAVY